MEYTDKGSVSGFVVQDSDFEHFEVLGILVCCAASAAGWTACLQATVMADLCACSPTRWRRRWTACWQNKGT